MKRLLFVLLVVFASCKKKDDEPVVPESKDGHLEVEYKTFAPAGTIKILIKLNGYTIDNSNKDTTYYKYDAIVKGGQPYNTHIQAYTTGYRTLLLVKFNGDTLNYNDTEYNVNSFSGTLPFVY